MFRTLPFAIMLFGLCNLGTAQIVQAQPPAYENPARMPAALWDALTAPQPQGPVITQAAELPTRPRGDIGLLAGHRILNSDEPLPSRYGRLEDGLQEIVPGVKLLWGARIGGYFVVHWQSNLADGLSLSAYAVSDDGALNLAWDGRVTDQIAGPGDLAHALRQTGTVVGDVPGEAERRESLIWEAAWARSASVGDPLPPVALREAIVGVSARPLNRLADIPPEVLRLMEEEFPPLVGPEFGSFQPHDEGMVRWAVQAGPYVIVLVEIHNYGIMQVLNGYELDAQGGARLVRRGGVLGGDISSFEKVRAAVERGDARAQARNINCIYGRMTLPPEAMRSLLTAEGTLARVDSPGSLSEAARRRLAEIQSNPDVDAVLWTAELQGGHLIHYRQRFRGVLASVLGLSPEQPANAYEFVAGDQLSRPAYLLRSFESPDAFQQFYQSSFTDNDVAVLRAGFCLPDDRETGEWPAWLLSGGDAP